VQNSSERTAGLPEGLGSVVPPMVVLVLMLGMLALVLLVLLLLVVAVGVL
jgi:hypothetical protein